MLNDNLVFFIIDGYSYTNIEKQITQITNQITKYVNCMPVICLSMFV